MCSSSILSRPKQAHLRNFLDPFLRPSTQKPEFFRQITRKKIENSEAVVKPDLLGILRNVCDVRPSYALLVKRYNIHETVASLWQDCGHAR